MAVSALGKRGVFFVRDHFDLIQRAIVFILAMVLALVYSAFDAHIGLTVLHNHWTFLLNV